MLATMLATMLAAGCGSPTSGPRSNAGADPAAQKSAERTIVPAEPEKWDIGKRVVLADGTTAWECPECGHTESLDIGAGFRQCQDCWEAYAVELEARQ